MAKSHVIHHIAGRTRLRAPSKRHDREYFRLVKKRIDQTGLRAQVNPSTASILIHHPHDTTEGLARTLIEAGLGELLDIELGVPASLVEGAHSSVGIVLLAGWSLYRLL